MTPQDHQQNYYRLGHLFESSPYRQPLSQYGQPGFYGDSNNGVQKQIFAKQDNASLCRIAYSYIKLYYPRKEGINSLLPLGEEPPINRSKSELDKNYLPTFKQLSAIFKITPNGNVCTQTSTIEYSQDESLQIKLLLQNVKILTLDDDISRKRRIAVLAAKIFVLLGTIFLHLGGGWIFSIPAALISVKLWRLADYNIEQLRGEIRNKKENAAGVALFALAELSKTK